MNMQKPSEEDLVTRNASAPPSLSKRRTQTAWKGAGAAVRVLLLAAPMRKMRYA
jgi:hypothetical protein